MPRFRSWLFSIAWNKTADWHRRRHRRVARADAEPASLPVAGGDVEVDALEHLSADRVDELLDHLTDDQRDVILLRIVADLSLEETAVALDRPVGAVKSLQHRALHALRRAIEPTPGDFPPEPVSRRGAPTTTEAR